MVWISGDRQGWPLIGRSEERQTSVECWTAHRAATTTLCVCVCPLVLRVVFFVVSCDIFCFCRFLFKDRTLCFDLNSVNRASSSRCFKTHRTPNLRLLDFSNRSTMAPHDIELRRGRYAKLDAPAEDDYATPTRRSFDSNDSSLEDLEEFDPLNYDAGTLKQKRSTGDLRARRASFKKAEFVSEKAQQRRKCTPSRLCGGLVLLFVAATVLLLSAGGIWAWKSAPENGLSPPWYPTPKGGTDAAWGESYKKAAALVKQMTLVEKVNITTGTGWSMQMCVGNTGPVPRLKFPALCLQDGPLGIRFADNITAFPAGITVGATWNKELMYQRGRAHGLEARLKGIHVLLGPAMGPLGRLPAGGRNFEGFGTYVAILPVHSWYFAHPI